MEPSKILLIVGIACLLLFIFFIAFKDAIKGKDGAYDKHDVQWPIYTLFVGVALFMGDTISDFKFACLVSGSAGVDIVVSIIKVWKPSIKPKSNE